MKSQVIRLSKLLERNTMFLGVGKEDILCLARNARWLHCKKNETIIKGGCIPFLLYIIYKGKVKISMCSASGKEVIIDVRRDGESFFEGASLTGEVSSSTVTALEDTVIFTINRQHIESLISRNPTFALTILRISTKRIRNAYEKLTEVITDTASQRIIRLLITLSLRYGGNIPLTREEMAEMSGLTIETSSRVITKLKKLGIIHTGRKSVIILDKNKLEMLSDMNI